MKQLVCERCGGNDFEEQNGFRICKYCDTRYVNQIEDTPQKNSIISIESDIKRLLNKCDTDPSNAVRYAGLVLDIDPGNSEAAKYINKKVRGR